MELVVFDLETTGFSPRCHEIIQIAAVRMRHGEVMAAERFETFVRPQGDLPDFISDLTGITSADVRNAPEPAPALLAFSRFVGDATLVAHNGWRFDLGFIRAGCERHQLPVRAVPFFDSMTLSRQLWGSAESHSLDAVMERLALSEAGLRRHDARGDVGILAEAVRTMWQRLGAPPDRCPVPLAIGHVPQ
jgi:DNA polymerase III alpha subunit (gram-positive type)